LKRTIKLEQVKEIMIGKNNVYVKIKYGMIKTSNPIIANNSND
jgi:hypothetical protein